MSRIEADSLKKIQTWWLKQYGYLDPYYWKSGTITWTSSWSDTKSSIDITVSTLSDDQYIKLYYIQTDYEGNKKTFDYKFPLLTTRCNFGGVRYWFQCTLTANGKYCGRRVGTLYKAGDYFGCRHCYYLSYESRNENRRFRDYPLFFLLTAHQKIDELEAKIKRKFYNGKPTKKQRTLYRLYSRMMPYEQAFSEREDLNIYK